VTLYGYKLYFCSELCIQEGGGVYVVRCLKLHIIVAQIFVDIILNEDCIIRVINNAEL
jgi:hypothetical protein